ncbi:NF038129 family PEP-CTERM protein [Pseudoduganella sp. LjRoot289]|uniref:NF038129 family PEP-CTERM protein n=1 Tax=Pseudoduganella sp. LjRoot289 TaxID=3342314 RepID=UPI003ECD4A5C
MRNDVSNNVKHKLASFLTRSALALALAAGCGPASAGVIHVTIDTASFGTSSGFVDMNFSTSDNVALETATVTNFAGFQSAPYVESWGLTAVAGGWQFSNHESNDLFQSVDFGGLLSFDLAFAGEIDPVSSYVSKFVVSAFGSDGFTPLGNYNPVTGALAAFAWTPALTEGTDGQIGFGVAAPNVTVVPEPGQCLLFGIGLAAFALARRRAG